ncbi:hypothetical protein RCG24_06550 [Neobacillus sp. OS1-32]|jgi:uncharacterized membrane protein YraQ (UPF0718 family)|uniref:hypothetical protein n=1 Tax=Neobacillus sp. OS1-32 TaxID=3070682 RepID=UPI0027E14CBC|nr:hypothetical protein [Neobacillus sp. OS1-32]WML31516.1 hypothetical protein RCG24_06550 [Neobacillus sp. OS1-32]
MSGSWRINAILGLTAFILSFVLSFVNNTWLTSLFRALIGFVLFFVLGYLLRFIFQQLNSRKSGEELPPQRKIQQFGAKVNAPIQEHSLRQEAVKGKEKNDTTGLPKENAIFQAISLDALHTKKGSDRSN